ncbi:MAG: RdgB/HAM1 family non-canonical purine NTP pyrophosphatase [Candidatus Micrarchaeaceae archaeon]
MEVLFATSNKNKVKEVSGIMGFTVKSRDMDLEEIQSASVEEVAKHKVLNAFSKLECPVIAEDTGLFIDGLDGFPGPLVKWATKGLGYEGICRIVDKCANRNAYAETCVAFYDGKSLKAFTGRIHGTIAMRPKGNGKFGWDHIFIPKGHRKTFAEMATKEKVAMSMRSMAFLKLGHFLKGKKLV